MAHLRLWISAALLVILAASLSILGSGPSGAHAQSTAASIGAPKAILDPSGVKLSVVVNDVQSPPRDVQDPPPGGGRWAVLDLSITNVGTNIFDLTAGDFQIMSPDTVVYQPDGSDDVPIPQLPETLLLPGQTYRGNVVFALPAGVVMQAVTFQASGTAQWVVALLSQ